MIWLKRLVPFVIIAAAIVVYCKYSDYQTTRQTRLEHDMAFATAHIWVASAKYRSDPERFSEYRDSVLAACSLSVADVRTFVDQNKDRPEKFYPYSKQLKQFVDSLLEIEDSLSAALKDSLRQVDPTIP